MIGTGYSGFGFGHHHHAASFGPSSFGHHHHAAFSMGPIVHSEFIPTAHAGVSSHTGFAHADFPFPSSPVFASSPASPFACQPLDLGFGGHFGGHFPTHPGHHFPAHAGHHFPAHAGGAPFWGHHGAAPPPPQAAGPPPGARGFGASSPAGPDRAYLPPDVGRGMGIAGYTAASPDGGAPEAVRPILRGGGKVGDPLPDPIDQKNAIGFTALHDAIKSGNLARCQELVEAGADLTLSGGPYEMYPLHLAAINGHPQVLAYLLSRGCDVTLTNQIGSTALVCSKGHSSKGGPECAALLEAAMREKGL